jgi:hypothetical protein
MILDLSPGNPTAAVPGLDGSDAVKRILGGVTTVANGVVAETSSWPDCLRRPVGTFFA